ncbi:MAG: hypothetical protein ABIA74_01465 [bacterium]
MELSVKAFAVTGAIFGGVYFFIAAILAMQSIAFFGFSNQVFELLVTGHPGFAATFIGAIVGLIYGMIHGAVILGLFAWVHNMVLKRIK